MLAFLIFQPDSNPWLVLALIPIDHGSESEFTFQDTMSRGPDLTGQVSRSHTVTNSYLKA